MFNIGKEGCNMMWKDDYKVGVDLIDEQHKELFRRLSAFIEVVQNEEPWDGKLDQVKETMIFMQEYVVTHFADEEVYQESIGYPEIEEHKLAHSKFKDSVDSYVEDFKSGGFTEEKLQEFSGKLMTWLIMHVGHMDKKIGEFVRNQGGN